MDEVLYRPSWQKLRVSCVQDYNQFRGFQTLDGATDNINRLNNYINDASTAGEGAADYAAQEAYSMRCTLDIEYDVRVYRVWNFMHATLNGLGSLHLPHIDTLKNYRDQLAAQLNTANVTIMADRWNWDVIEEELKVMWINERVWFTRIYNDMKERIIEKDEVSPSMLKFTQIMTNINTL